MKKYYFFHLVGGAARPLLSPFRAPLPLQASGLRCGKPVRAAATRPKRSKQVYYNNQKNKSQAFPQTKV